MKPVRSLSIFRIALAILFTSITAHAVYGVEKYSFTREIRLAPGEFYAVRYDAKRREFVSEEPGRAYEGLNQKTQMQILRAPIWLREKLADRLVDLYYDDIDVGENAAPTFFDVNNDGSCDLIVGNGEGKLQCFLGPFFKEDKQLFKHVRVSGNAVPCFYDLDCDDSAELYVGDAYGGLTAWEGKNWMKITSFKNLPFSGQVHLVSTPDKGLVVGDETKRLWYVKKKGKFRLVKNIETGDNGSLTPSFEAYGTLCYLRGYKDGKISHVSRDEIPRENLINIQSPKVAGNARPVIQDVNGDNIPDLVIGSADGTLSVFINHGLINEPWFATYPRRFEKKFPHDTGYLSSPRIADIDDDGSFDVVTGAKAGIVRILKGSRFTEIIDLSDSLRFSGPVIPAPADFDSDGRIDIACGLKDGTILIYKGPEFTQKRKVGKVDSYAAPYPADFDGDGRCDLVVGSGDGKIVFLHNTDDGFEEKSNFFGEIKGGDYPCPAVTDVNEDGKLDLVVGNREGPVKVFLGQDWKESLEGLGLGTKETFTVPGFGALTGDGKPELVLGSLAGTFLYYEKEEGGWVEKQSWQFESSTGLKEVTGYFTRCHPESELLRGMIDSHNVKSFTKVLEKSDDKFFDETAFALAAMSTEILRSMGRVENADILLENARCIYEMAEKVEYAEIVEKQDYTTIEYFCEDGVRSEMPRDVYYWWLVHPRLYYEIPLHVDPSYWEYDHEHYGVTHEQWTRKEIDLENIGNGAKCEFWRSYFLHDKKYGKTLLDVVLPAKTVEEAVYLMSDWISQHMPESWYVYGRKSADLQPMVIYQKNYGSCGESATMGAAFSRTMLVASSCAGCGGEDHVWNEFWLKDKWYAWDLGPPSFQLRYPWRCCEGIEHKGTQSIAITRPRGDGLLQSRTALVDQPKGSKYTASGKGYTETAQVIIQVVDADDYPVEGAAIIVRSDCRDYWRTAIWGYTDPQGFCFFELGKPQKKCMFDVITQQGLTGTSHLPIKENRTYSLKYMLPGKFNAPTIQWIESPTEGLEENEMETVKIETKILEEFQRPRNLATARRKRDDISEFMKKTKYTGTRWAPHTNREHRGLALAQLDQIEFERFKKTQRLQEAYRMIDTSLSTPFTQDGGDVYLFYNPNRFTHIRFSTTVTASVPKAEPEIRLTSSDKEVYTGENISFSGNVSDNLNIAALKFSKDGGVTWTDITNSLDRDRSAFFYTWNTGEGGPVPPGKYSVVFRVEDNAGAASKSRTVEVNLKPAREFRRQIIYQDNADSPLPKSSWILGPFTVRGDERFLGITTKSQDPEFDLDLFLFQDKNRNRKLDGIDEELSKSTTPAADEKIVMNASPGAVYWIYCQGWKVKERKELVEEQFASAELPPGKFLALEIEDAEKKTTYALTDINLSFDYQHAFITDVGPTDQTPMDEVIIKGIFDPEYKVDSSTVRIFIDEKDFTIHAEVNAQGYEMKLDSTLEEHVYSVRVEAKTHSGMTDCAEWNFKSVSIPVIVKSTPEEEEKSVKVEVECRMDNILEWARARFYRVKSDKASEWFNLQVSGNGKNASGHLSTIGHGRGSYKVTLEFKLKGFESDTIQSSFKLDKGAPLSKKLVVHPPNESKIFDFRPVLAGFAVGETKEKVKSMKLTLDGNNITDKCKNYGSVIKFFPDADLSLGEHNLVCNITLEGGNHIEERSKFVVKIMRGSKSEIE